MSSIKQPKHNNFFASGKNNLFNQKAPSFNQKNSFKKYNFNEKINLYKKKKESQHYINSVSSKFPIDLLSKPNSQFANYNHLKNNANKYQNNNKKNKTNNSQLKNNLFNNNININKSLNYNHKVPKGNINNSNNSNSINTNNYIINTLNVSEKNFLRSGISSAKPQKSVQKITRDYESEINKLIKEKEECENTLKKQGKLIEKLIEDNEKLDNKITYIENENKKISKKIEVHQENQEQLIMLVKIVQKSGVDVEQLIDKWNNDVEMENNYGSNNSNDSTNNMNYNKDNNNEEESLTDSINELNSKIDPSSFIPINIEEPHVNKEVIKGIPKLNFDIIKNGEENNKKGKFRNHSK